MPVLGSWAARHPARSFPVSSFALRIGAEIDRGVPWIFAEDTGLEAGLHLALTSGTLGAEDIFIRGSSSNLP
jgi:uncharacterized protein YgbK (DUF1537 family)